MTHLFLSYKHEDGDFATLLQQELEKIGIEVRTDKNILAGEEWRGKIDTLIREAFAVIVIMSPEAQASEYVTYEWAFAWGAFKPIIPVIYRKVEKLHPRLEAFQHLDFTHQNLRPWDILFERVSDLFEQPSIDVTLQPVQNLYRELFKHLFNPYDEFEKFAVIDEFVAIGEPALNLLHRHLGASVPDDRVAVIMVLKELRSPASVLPLTHILWYDPVWDVQRVAAEALEVIGTEEALRALGHWRSSGGNIPPKENLPF